MSKRPQLPIALTIAGSDSGGGAGIQADLKTFAALGVHGTSAITCITAQNPKGVHGIQACSVEIVRRQIEAVFDELRPAAVKTGMLYSAPIIRVVAEFFRRRQRCAAGGGSGDGLDQRRAVAEAGGGQGPVRGAAASGHAGDAQSGRSRDPGRGRS